MSTEFELFTAIGNAFHRRGAATAKDRPPQKMPNFSVNLGRCERKIQKKKKKKIQKNK